MEHISVDERKEGLNIDSQYFKYLKLFESMKADDNLPLDPFEKGELINSCLLKESVLKTLKLGKFPNMQTLPEAIEHSFQNGHAKYFCQECSLLCSKDVGDVFGAVGPRDETFTDGFKLERDDRLDDRCKSKIELRSHSSFMAEDNISTCTGRSSGSSSSTPKYYAAGNHSADFMVSSVSGLPLVIFECKLNHSQYKKGFFQLISHGLALRDKRQVKHTITFVLITPTKWYMTTLSQFKEEDQFLDICFKKFPVLVWKCHLGVFLHQKAYLAYLRNLHQAFEPVKSVE